nr:zinc finger, CCHC-type [Tanacetum cinerariifolium]
AADVEATRGHKGSSKIRVEAFMTLRVLLGTADQLGKVFHVSKCYNCNKFGHVRRNCKLKDKGQEQSNLVQEDTEPTLLMAVQEKRDKGKHSRAPFPNQTNTKSSEPLNLVCGDLCGPISPETESGNKYMFLLIDDCTRYMWVYFLKSKDEALETFKEFKLKVENEVGKKLKSLRTDKGVYVLNRVSTKALNDSTPYEALKDRKPMNMPQIFWAEAIRHAVYVLNRVSTKALKDYTPYEALNDIKPNMRYLRVFGCKAYAKVTKPHLKKLDDRSKELVYLGTQPGSKAYRLFDPVTKDMVVSRDVKFKEDKGCDWKGYLDNINPSKPEWRDFIISENQTSSSRIIDEVSTQDSEINNEDSAPSPIQNNAHDDISDDDEIEQPMDNPSTPPPYTYEPNSEDSTEHTSSIASSSRLLDHTPVRGYRNLSEIYNRALEVQKEEPRNYKEAAQDKKWIEAMQIEIDSINKNKTWKLATLPDNQKAIVRMKFAIRISTHSSALVYPSKGGSAQVRFQQQKIALSPYLMLKPIGKHIPSMYLALKTKAVSVISRDPYSD